MVRIMAIDKSFYTLYGAKINLCNAATFLSCRVASVVASGASLEERGVFRARLCHDRCWSPVSLDTVTGQTLETDTDLVLELIVLTNTSIT